jgi:hypothetical protein
MTARKPKTLAEDLAELERTDPKVAASARKLDKVTAEITQSKPKQAWPKVEAWAVVGTGLPQIEELYRQRPSLNQDDVKERRRVVHLTERDPDAEAELRRLRMVVKAAGLFVERSGRMGVSGALTDFRSLIVEVERYLRGKGR